VIKLIVIKKLFVTYLELQEAKSQIKALVEEKRELIAHHERQLQELKNIAEKESNYLKKVINNSDSECKCNDGENLRRVNEVLLGIGT
jgi:predicted RNA-binding protein Jag